MFLSQKCCNEVLAEKFFVDIVRALGIMELSFPRTFALGSESTIGGTFAS